MGVLKEDFKELCGTINWLKQFLLIPDEEMKQLSSLLKGQSAPSMTMALTKEAKDLLKKKKKAG